jgi:hypothetical protein
MITGANTDARFEGTVYHVQTEHRGVADDPVIESLIYCGGQILHHVRTECRALGAEGEGEREIARALDTQHRDLVRRARHGEFAGDSLPTMAQALGDEPALSDAIAELLDQDEEADLLTLAFERRDADTGFAGRICVRQLRDGLPAPGARLTLRLVGRQRDPVVVLEGESDADGQLAVALAVPPAGGSALLVAAERGAGGGRLRIDL